VADCQFTGGSVWWISMSNSGGSYVSAVSGPRSPRARPQRRYTAPFKTRARRAIADLAALTRAAPGRHFASDRSEGTGVGSLLRIECVTTCATDMQKTGLSFGDAAHVLQHQWAVTIAGHVKIDHRRFTSSPCCGQRAIDDHGPPPRRRWAPA
jgi:hypothetical protein